MVRIASFDIGVKSFAECVMDVDVMPGITSSSIADLERVHVAVMDFSGEDSKYTPETRQKLLTHLEEQYKLWDSCDWILIEQQMSALSKFNKSKVNIHAIRVSETLHTWFEWRNRQRIRPLKVVDVPSTWKTKYLNAPSKMTYDQRKNWSVQYMKTIIEKQSDVEMMAVFEIQRQVKGTRNRNDDKTQQLLTNHGLTIDSDAYRLAYRVVMDHQKLDDVADTYSQLVGYLVHEKLLKIE